MDYAVYVCYDKNVLNFHGIRAAVAGTGGHNLGMGFGEFIDEVLGNRQWRASYLPIGAGYLYKSMRDVIAQKLNANIWLEVCVGRSKHAYCALDVYMDVWTPSGRSCQDNAHFLLYSHFEKGERELVVPGKWWQYDIYQSYGQQPPWNEWVLEDQGVATVTSMPPQAAKRMAVLLGHVSGDSRALPSVAQALLRNPQARALEQGIRREIED